MLRPELAEVHKLLADECGVIVHFSGCPPMHVQDWGKAHLFPKDLQHVVAGNANSGISCSAICADDSFDGENGASTGYIGVIVVMNSKDSLIIAAKGDDGTRIDEHRNRVALNDRDLTVEDLKATLELEKGHNEWAIRDFTVKGMFVVLPGHVWHRYPNAAAAGDIPPELQDSEFLQGEDCGPRQATITELRQSFPNIPIYTFHEGGIVRVEGAQRTPVRPEEFYPLS
jgi:hypothetical protein